MSPDGSWAPPTLESNSNGVVDEPKITKDSGKPNHRRRSPAGLSQLGHAVSTVSRVFGWQARGYLLGYDWTMGSRRPDHACLAHPSSIRDYVCGDVLNEGGLGW